MAKVSMIEREKKRARTVSKYSAKRAELKKIISGVDVSDEERWAATIALQKLPRDAGASSLSGYGKAPRRLSEVRSGSQQVAHCSHER